ncbi:MAG: hypothetical protein BAJALOKI2v1_360027 [Promethearchaeota archaeon]|nr:MAG: hypothetical protein BAJALOKI2v1_360027 [Candidatus Lokiarchaeota archaeon]
MAVTNSELENILDVINDRLQGLNGEGFNLKIDKNIFFQIVINKRGLFEEFTEMVREKWEKFKNGKTIIDHTYTTFLYERFNEFYSYFIEKFYGLDNSSLDLIDKENVSDSTLLLEYKYYLSKEEQRLFKRTSQDLENKTHGLVFPTAYVFSITAVFGIILRKTIKQKFYIQLDGAVLKGNERDYLNFLIIVKDSKDQIYTNYLHMQLFIFLKPFNNVPERYYNKLLKGRDNLYTKAIQKYHDKDLNDQIVNLLYYFYRKCILLNHISPILDFFNFVCSRVEDSVFSKINVIRKDYLANFDEISLEKKSSLIKIFNFLDRKSTLSSTFLANNLPHPKSQLNLFLLYKKYYFGSGLEALEVGDVLFLPDLFRKNLNNYNKDAKYPIDSNSIKHIANFLNYFSVISNVKNINLFFLRIFGRNVSEVNYFFFRTFFKSFNKKFFNIIQEENKNLSNNSQEEDLTFPYVSEHICRMLYVLIDKIFIKENLEEASENFHDKRGRYVGKNIALRVLELFFFQDFNFSDDLWPDYIISWNKEKVKRDVKKFDLTIPDKYFYSENDLTRFLITYNLQSFSKELFLEEWLLQEIIIPLNNFIQTIKHSAKQIEPDLIKKELVDFFGKNIDDEEILKDIEFVSQQLSMFWDVFK